MSFFTSANLEMAREIISRYPMPRSALIPLLHLAQEQHGWVTDEAMRQVADLCGVTPAEVKGTGSFYEMFKFHPVGSYLINVCTNISCMLVGGEELLEHAQQRLGVNTGATTPDGMFTLEEVECIAACTEAPCLQVNYRYRLRVSGDDFDQMVNDIAAGRADDLPRHGTLATVRQRIGLDRVAQIVAPEEAREAPVWLKRNDPTADRGAQDRVVS
ncbi:MAG: NAD(P)H-dependent oxidoreductase subunit E [Acidimicrobiaceae bacterium]|nr:NAD(P)H-dependent oxidoreductase subunit E [Acidimicrobiia bacterium]MCY4493024.1 NAD(P)H-dependent oxidoreductase subunit E [Acidimicrobiaceae bacterium]